MNDNTYNGESSSQISNQIPDQTSIQNPQTPKDPEMIDKKKIILIIIGAIIGVVAISIGIVFLIRFIEKQGNSSSTSSAPTTSETTTSETTTPKQIDLQLAVNQWLVDESSDNVGVMIYDIDNNAVVARHNEDKQFRIESIYKMFVAYEGYFRIDNGQWAGESLYTNLGNNYQKKAFTRNLCLDEMIRFSYSPCAETMWSEIGHDTLQSIYDEKGYKSTNIQALLSTPSDLAKLYQQYWSHSDLKDETWKTILDSMLNQPTDPYSGHSYNYRRGLPQGFNTASVYNKVGWLNTDSGWLYYDDAAFVEFPETKDSDNKTVPARHYIVIALTTKTSYTELVKLGRAVESAVKVADNYE